MFRIFVAGDSLRSERAVELLREICLTSLGYTAEIEVVDVLGRPDRAEEEKIIATPTVVRLLPSPARRVIGDLTDFDLAASALGLPSRRSADGDGYGAP